MVNFHVLVFFINYFKKVDEKTVDDRRDLKVPGLKKDEG